MVLTYLSNDAAICARIPDLASTVLEMHRAYHGLDLVKLAEAEHPNLNLELLARRKGCRLERAGPGDRWRIVRAGGRPDTKGHRPAAREARALSRGQVLDALRSLPDPH
jgi:hypothetical protein